MWRHQNGKQETPDTRSNLFLSLDGASKAAVNDYLSAENAAKAAQQLASLAIGWRKGGKSRVEVEHFLLLSRWFRDERMARGLSLGQLATLTGFDPEFLRLLESGMASSEEIESAKYILAEALDLEIPDFTDRKYLHGVSDD